jgi:hypothetical protein
MPVADASAVDAALVALLLGDATLTTFMPDGVFFDVSGKNATRFVIVSQLAHADDYLFNASAYESFEYLVKAVTGPTLTDANYSGGQVKAAAARIHTLLEDQPLAPAGYSLMVMQRLERIRYTEPDADNEDARWHHRGGRYSVIVSPS